MPVMIRSSATPACEYRGRRVLASHYGVLPIRRVMESFPLLAGQELQTVELLGLHPSQAAHKALDAVVARRETKTIHQVLVDRLGVALQAHLIFDPRPVRLPPRAR